MNDTPSPAPISASQDSEASGANGEALPGWPRHPRYTLPPELNMYSDHWRAAVLDYHCDLATAWEARARLAVEALSCLYPALVIDLRYCDVSDDHDALVSRVKGIEEALAAIGPLPSPKEPKEQRT